MTAEKGSKQRFQDSRTKFITEWVNLFDDSILAKSAMDRLAHNAHQMIIVGESYRKEKGTMKTAM